MRTGIITAALALSLMTLGIAQVMQAQGRPSERQATPGLAASGQVVSESGGVLRLDTTPCRDTQAITVFRQPYAKEPAGEVNCKGARRGLVQVVQR